MKKTAGVCRVFMLEVNIVTESEGAVKKVFIKQRIDLLLLWVF